MTQDILSSSSYHSRSTYNYTIQDQPSYSNKQEHDHQEQSKLLHSPEDFAHQLQASRLSQIFSERFKTQYKNPLEQVIERLNNSQALETMKAVEREEITGPQINLIETSTRQIVEATLLRQEITKRLGIRKESLSTPPEELSKKPILAKRKIIGEVKPASQAFLSEEAAHKLNILLQFNEHIKKFDNKDGIDHYKELTKDQILARISTPDEQREQDLCDWAQGRLLRPVDSKGYIKIDGPLISKL